MKRWFLLLLPVSCAHAVVAVGRSVPALHAALRTEPEREPPAEQGAWRYGVAARGEADDWLPATGVERPKLVASLEKDVADLPRAIWDAPDPHSTFRVTPTGPNELHFVIDGVSFGEVSLGDFVAYTGNNYFRGTWPDCTSPKHVSPHGEAIWRGLSSRHWSASGVDVIMSRGPFDPVACTAKPTATLHARAMAIVPGFVYALRVQDDALYVIAPHASLASASDDKTGSGPFSSATLPLEPHRDTAAALRLPLSSINAWRGGRLPSDKEEPAPFLLTIEVRSRGDRFFVAVSASSVGTPDPAYAPLISAMRPPESH